MFTIRIAGHEFCIENQYDFVENLCKNYIVPNCNAKKILVTDSEIQREKDSNLDFSRGYLESLAVYRKVCEQLIDENILLFHGSVIAVDGQAYLFTATSGTGKSTHTRLWREYFGNRAVMVNDDKPLLKISDKCVIVYGTPWDGKHHLSSNISVPLKAICILERAENNRIEQIEKNTAYPMLLQQSYRPYNPQKMMTTLRMLDELITKIDLYKLGCNMNIEAAKIAFDMMKG